MSSAKAVVAPPPAPCNVSPSIRIVEFGAMPPTTDPATAKNTAAATNGFLPKMKDIDTNAGWKIEEAR
jgi:hypothetical protein